jgi:hypothetical protein
MPTLSSFQPNGNMSQSVAHAGSRPGNMKGLAMSVAEQAKRVYETRLKAELEAKHRDRFVAIEPVSESFFLGDQFIDAALAAKKAFPNRKSFVIRVGHEAAFHIGGFAS